MSRHLQGRELLSAFRNIYQQYEQAVTQALHNSADSTVLARLGDDLDEFATLATHVSQVSILPVVFRLQRYAEL
jgi:hypothetical protein